MNFLGKNHIGYQVSNLGSQVFYGFDPQLNQPLETPFHQASSDEIELALEKAQAAFKIFRVLPLKKRIEFFQEIRRQIQLNSSDLIEWYCKETALPKSRAEGELNRTIYQFEYYLESIQNGYVQARKTNDCQLEQGTNQVSLTKWNIPIGPVLVFGASNFPFAYGTLGGDVASALIAGCPVIVKAHPMHPHTSSISAQIIVNAAQITQMPDGVFSHLLADDNHVAEKLVKDERIQAVGFTGSISGGNAILKLIQQRSVPIPIYAEMGSSNPIIVFYDALKKNKLEIARKIADSVKASAGQFCTSPGLVFLQKSEIARDFTELLKEEFKQIAPQFMLHPRIFENYQKRASEQFQKTDVLFRGYCGNGQISPSLVRINAEVFLKDSSIQEEIFGSFLTLVICENDEQLNKCIHQLKGQLTISVFTEDEKHLHELFFDLAERCGRIIFNGVPTGVEVSVAQQHGGPFPSSSSYFSSVGWDAVMRFVRPISVQNISSNTIGII